ncbi:MAG: D-alanine--D-alanine ligase A, partial [Mycobacteriaceae bacterium]
MGERRTRVAVVFGGQSSEHAVSCVSAGSVLAQLDADRFEVVPVGIARDGSWVLGTSDLATLSFTQGRLPSVDPNGAALTITADPTRAGDVISLARAEAGTVL